MDKENSIGESERKLEVIGRVDELAAKAEQMNDLAARLREKLQRVLRTEDKGKDKAITPQYATPLANTLAQLDDSFGNARDILEDIIDRLEV